MNVQSAMNLLKWLEGTDIIRGSTLSFPILLKIGQLFAFSANFLFLILAG